MLGGGLNKIAFFFIKQWFTLALKYRKPFYINLPQVKKKKKVHFHNVLKVRYFRALILYLIY